LLADPEGHRVQEEDKGVSAYDPGGHAVQVLAAAREERPGGHPAHGTEGEEEKEPGAHGAQLPAVPTKPGVQPATQTLLPGEEKVLLGQTVQMEGDVAAVMPEKVF